MPVSVKNLKKPTKKKGKGEPPKETPSVSNLQKPKAGEKVPIQVKVDPGVRRDFRSYAVERDLELSELFVAMFDFYRENQG